MKAAIISDLHANWPALREVAADAERRQVDQFWFLGDIVDRGPHPVEVTQWVHDHVQPENWVLGNHDAMLMGWLTAEQRSRVSADVLVTVQLHRQILQSNTALWQYISEMFEKERGTPCLKQWDGTAYYLTHNGFIDPIGYYRYLYGYSGDLLLEDEFSALDTLRKPLNAPAVAFFGHSHVSCLTSASPEESGWAITREMIVPFKPYKLEPNRLWLISPGSVGSPRDLDNRASYAVLNTEKQEITFVRVAYPWRETQGALIDNDYNPMLEERLRDAPTEENAPIEWVEHYRRVSGMKEEA